MTIINTFDTKSCQFLHKLLNNEVALLQQNGKALYSFLCNEYGGAVIENPALVNMDAYEIGWLVELKPNRLNEIQSLFNKEDYQNEIIKEN